MTPTTTGIGWRHPHYGELLEAQPTVGFLEVHSENFFGAGGAALAVLQQARASYPVSLHGVGLGLGSAVGIDNAHLDRLAHLVERTEPWLVSDHASFARGTAALATPGRRAVHAADLLPIPFNRDALNVLCTNVQRVQDRLRRPLAVENLSAYVHWNDNDQTEPEFLAALVQRTGCRLLVDVNNIYVNALNDAKQRPELSTGAALRQCQSWLDAIPSAAVAEIHLAGHIDCGDIVIDDHGSRVGHEVWQLYRHALQRFGPVPALVEWDTEIPTLSVLLEEAARADQMAASITSIPRITPMCHTTVAGERRAHQ